MNKLMKKLTLIAAMAIILLALAFLMVRWTGANEAIKPNVMLAEITDYSNTAPQHRVDLGRFYTVNQTRLVFKWDEPISLGITVGDSNLPFIGNNATMIVTPVDDMSEIQVGDIIVYRWLDTPIMHRVVAIGLDEKGWYAKTKGYNNPSDDWTFVRTDMVESIVLGIFW